MTVDEIRHIVEALSTDGRRLARNIAVLCMVWLALYQYNQYERFHVDRQVRHSQTLLSLLEAASKVVAAFQYKSGAVVHPVPPEATQALQAFETLYFGAYGLIDESPARPCFTVLRRELIVAATGLAPLKQGSDAQVHLQTKLMETSRAVRDVHDRHFMLLAQLVRQLGPRSVPHCS